MESHQRKHEKTHYQFCFFHKTSENPNFFPLSARRLLITIGSQLSLLLNTNYSLIITFCLCTVLSLTQMSDIKKFISLCKRTKKSHNVTKILTSCSESLFFYQQSRLINVSCALRKYVMKAIIIS